MTNRILITFFLSLCLDSGISQTFTPCLNGIQFSEKPKGTKKITSIIKALEDPSKVYHLKIYFNDSELHRLDSFFNNVERFVNLHKLQFIHGGQIRKKENIPDSFYRFLPKLEMLVLWVEAELSLRGISQLNHLKYLEVHMSATKEIPEELYRINSLECLNFGCTEIKTISPSIGKLENLKYLNLETNLLEGFPKQVLLLPNLKYLDVSNHSRPYPLLHCGDNKITSVPDEIMKMPNLEELVIIGFDFSADFWNNHLPYFIADPKVKVRYR